MGDELKLPPGATLVSPSSIGDQSIALPPGATLVSDTPVSEQPKKEGFLHSAASVFGLTPEAASAATADIKAHPVRSIIENSFPLSGFIKNAVNTAPDMAKKAYSEAQQSNEAMGKGDLLASLLHEIGGAGYLGATALSPFLGNSPAKAGEQIGQGNVSGGLGTTAAITLPFLASAGAIGISDAIPTKAAAGELFKAADAAASKVPIDLSGPGNIALDIQKAAQSGGRAPKVITDFVKRTTDPDKGPLTYTEAREFYSNATRLSADESMSLTPAMKMRLGQFTKSLGDSIAGAADKAGVLPQYLNAMRQYRQASRLDSAMDVIKDKGKDALVKGALQGAGAAGASYGIYKMIDAFKNR